MSNKRKKAYMRQKAKCRKRRYFLFYSLVKAVRKSGIVFKKAAKALEDFANSLKESEVTTV